MRSNVRRRGEPRGGMKDRMPLPALLSHALVAFTIEFDNESEHQLPHRTTRHDSTPGALHTPWLVSMAMWFNCMRFVNDAGVKVRDLEQLARTQTNLNGMLRWGYIRLEPDPNDSRPKPPRSAGLIRPTRAGRNAQAIWQPLVAVIENRWRQRFGDGEIDRLRQSLRALVDQFDFELPDCLPILGYGLVSRERAKLSPRQMTTPSDIALPSLLSKVLLMFAIEFESESGVSLAVSANVLRLTGLDGTRVRDLPRLAGVSKESIGMALTFLTNRGFAKVQPESPGSKVKALALTPKGEVARARYFELLPEIEQRWQERFGKEAIGNLRDSLECIGGDGTAQGSPLFRGLEPYPDGWRAAVAGPETLPHFPMVLHRGGYPDGS